MCMRGDCTKAVGQWVQFRTQWGSHRGIVHAVNDQAVLMRVPKQYAPSPLTATSLAPESESGRLDLALAQWGYGYGAPGAAYGGPGYGYGAGPGYGRPGYGWWAGGWWFWWLAFAWIFAFAFLW